MVRNDIPAPRAAQLDTLARRAIVDSRRELAALARAGRPARGVALVALDAAGDRRFAAWFPASRLTPPILAAAGPALRTCDTRRAFVAVALVEAPGTAEGWHVLAQTRPLR